MITWQGVRNLRWMSILVFYVLPTVVACAGYYYQASFYFNSKKSLFKGQSQRFSSLQTSIFLPLICSLTCDRIWTKVGRKGFSLTALLLISLWICQATYIWKNIYSKFSWFYDIFRRTCLKNIYDDRQESSCQTFSCLIYIYFLINL
jgi:hypothetical protein